MPEPIALDPAQGLSTERAGFRAAVGRDGTVYTSIDITGVTEPVVLDIQILGLPLRFTRNDVVFFNTQGFVMQKLVSSTNQPIPGMDVRPAENPAADSDVLHYSRHEFATYFLQHFERLAHALDPTDPQWHLNGTPHIDHDHLIVAITGRTNDNTTLHAGPTTTSTFESVGNSLFSMGLTGKSAVTIRARAVVDSYTRGTTTYGSSGDVFTNGLLTVKRATIKGSVAAGSHLVENATITGTTTRVTSPISFMEADIPSGLPSLGTITLWGGYKKITGPGSFRVDSISLTSSSQLYIDNSAGPVTLYVTGPVSVSDWSIVSVADANPEKFAVYVPGNEPVTINADAYFSGVIYAPNSTLRLSGVGGYFGAFVGDRVIVNDGSKIHYDNALLGVTAPASDDD